MSIDHGSRESAGSDQARPTGDPLQMTEAEKRAAEREARHDVAARGRRPGAETVQHYVAHERLVHGAPSHPSGKRPAARTPVRPVRPTPSPPPRPSGLRGLLRRLLARGD